MSVRSSKNQHFVFVGGDAALSSGAKPTSLNAGEIGCFKPDGTRITDAVAAAMATGDPFVIAMKPSSTDNTIIVSPVLRKGVSVIKATAEAYAAEQEQIDYIGYDGATAGTKIDAQNLNEYLLSISLQQNVTSNHGGWYTLDSAYTSDAAATQDEIASGIVEPLINSIRMEADRPILVERLCDEAGIAATAATGTITYYNNSKYVACSGGTPSTDFSVGDWIRVAVGTTVAVYKVVGVDDTGNGYLTLDVPFQGTSGTTAFANIRIIAAATAAAADFGIKLTGVQKKFSVGKLHNSKVSWKLSLGNWGTTVHTESQKASLGHGTERYVKELEWFTNGYDGEMYRKSEPYVFSQRALASGTYHTIHLQIKEATKDTLGMNVDQFVITLCVPAGLGANAPAWADSSVANTVVDVIETLVGATAGSLLVVA